MNNQSEGGVMDELTKHLRQYAHNDGSGPVFGYDKTGVDREFAMLEARAMPRFETADDLIAWLDTLYATEGAAVTNRKWEPAQRAIAALRSKVSDPVNQDGAA
jgi:hypothetical protein